jgi:hypothetical protein
LLTKISNVQYNHYDGDRYGAWQQMNNLGSFYMSDDKEEDESAQETNPGEQKEIRWEIVARMPGITPATILAGRLQAEGIPVRAWQEGAGQALGLTVGLLGTGYVAVPEEYAAHALEILATDADWVEDWDEEE